MYAGCVGVATTEPGSPINEYVLKPPAALIRVYPNQLKRMDPVAGFTEMERPSVIYRQGIYHMFFHTWWYGIHPEHIKRQ